MPGPGAKGKASKKKPVKAPQVTAESQAALRDGIDNAEGWNACVDFMCDYFKLPDLTTRSGLKKVHANFETISRKLDAAYNRDPTDERLVGTIIGIYAKMCNDAILRDKLFKQGLVAKVMPLLDMPFCQQLAMQSLSNMTHHGGRAARAEIARQTPRLVRLLREHSDDGKLAELTVATLAHAIGAVAADERAPDPKLVRELELPVALKTVCEVLKRENASDYLITHAEELFTSVSYHCADDMKKCPEAVGFLIAMLRSEDIGERGSALAGLLRLVGKESVFDRMQMDPQKFIAAARGRWPDDVVDMQMDYGMFRLETSVTALAMRDFQNAMMAAAQDKDMYKLGLSLAELVLRTEFSIGDGMFQAEGEPRGRVFDIGLPFTRFGDALPHCAKAIRQRGAPMEQDLADILDCKYLVMKQRLPDAFAHARRAIEKHPDVGYFHYVLSLSANHEEALRAAKNGRKCKKHMTPFVQHALLHRAIAHASDMALTALMESRPGMTKWKQGIGFLRSACEDAKQYIAKAPPDQRQMKTVMNWFIILECIVKGPEMDEELADLQPLVDRLRTVEACARHLQMEVANTQERNVRVLILQHYVAAWKHWGPVVKRYDELALPAPVDLDGPQAEDEFARWLEKLTLEDGSQGTEYCSHPKLGSGWATQLYRCSNCGSPSSVLRKCAGCDKARYCDEECQKTHWTQHKAACKQ